MKYLHGDMKSSLHFLALELIFVLFHTSITESAATGVEQKLQPGWGQSFTIYKPGKCPPSDPNMYCYEQKDLCKSDCECSRMEKCCYQENCGYSCKPPMGVANSSASTCNTELAPSLKPGNCPKPDENVQCVHCYDQCRSDCECEGTLKCCSQPGCGNQCKKATQTSSCGGCGWKQV